MGCYAVLANEVMNHDGCGYLCSCLLNIICRGFLHEIFVIILGFITSLLPAWNYNPDDAAAFAAGQAMDAREGPAQGAADGEAPGRGPVENGEGAAEEGAGGGNVMEN